MKSFWIGLNILICAKFEEWNQTDSDSTVNSDVK